MPHRRPFGRRLLIRYACALVAGVLVLTRASSAQTSPSSGRAAIAAIRGVATDSTHGSLLVGAFVALLPTSREVVTDSAGAFHFDSVPPGASYRLRVLHALVDTLGISLTTPSFAVRAGESKVIDVAIPSPTRLVTSLCTPALLRLGPAALVGFVRDPDTGDAIDSVTLSLVYDESPVRTAHFLVTRVGHVGPSGRYVICGLPMNMAGGQMLISRNGLALADIPVSTADSPITPRGLGVSRDAIRIAAAERKGRTPGIRVLKGDARLVGKVVTRLGRPVTGAHVQMDGTRVAATTRADGSFTLDGLPAGTQSLSVRKIGLAPAEAAVDVTSADNAPVLVTMAERATVLDPVVTIAQRTKDLDAVGFTQRKQMGIGYFREGEQIDKGPTDLGESLRMIPGLHIAYDANSQTSQKTLIMSSRDANECVNIIIDGVVWQDAASSIEEYVRPNEIEALEMYNPATVPGEFVVPGNSSCAVLVIWTKRRIHPAAQAP